MFYTTALSKLVHLFQIYTCVLLTNVSRSNKETNRLISKRMSNVYLNSSYWAKLKFSKFRFSASIKSRLRGPGVSAYKWLFYYFIFERNYDVLKSKILYLLMNKNINFNKNEKVNRERKIPHTLLNRQALCFSSYKNCELKMKLMSWSFREKKAAFFNLRKFL